MSNLVQDNENGKRLHFFYIMKSTGTLQNVHNIIYQSICLYIYIYFSDETGEGQRSPLNLYLQKDNHNQHDT